MTEKIIKNEQWYVKILASKVTNNEIFKPKFQRKRKWDLLPKKENIPSEKKYIEFLYYTYNSVHAITFGQDHNKLSNIDGNNRINAIIHFLEEPFVLFPEKIVNLILFIKNTINENIANEVEKIITKMRYDELMTFKYKSYFIEKGYDDLYNNHLRNIRDEIEELFDDLIDNMKINGKDRFDNDVIINVNIFIGYSTEELAEIFGGINKYNSGLTEQEALASRLFNNTNFEIEDKILEYEIKQNLKKYYEDKSQKEILSCYNYDESNDTMNAYDFMVGIQYYSNNKCDLIPSHDKDGVSLYFKIFKSIYKDSLDNTFTTTNVNNFINYILKTIDMLEKIKKNIFMENLVSDGNKLFDTANKKLKSLKKNNLYLIICAIIGYINNNIPEKDILKSIEICILYHFFVNTIEDKEKRAKYNLVDGLLYEAGGKFIDNKAKEYLKDPKNISNSITKQYMSDVLVQLNTENIKNKIYETRTNGKDKYDKRRQRKLYEKVLIYYYYRHKVPSYYLQQTFWIEHLFPFSSSWEEEIDIDRLGNIFPITEKLNRDRGTKHINEYKKIDKTDFLKYIDIIPTVKIYDKIIKHDNRKPNIINSEEYNNCCLINEIKLIECFLNKIYI